jgi:hypothetical protein
MHDGLHSRPCRFVPTSLKKSARARHRKTHCAPEGRSVRPLAVSMKRGATRSGPEPIFSAAMQNRPRRAPPAATGRAAGVRRGLCMHRSVCGPVVVPPGGARTLCPSRQAVSAGADFCGGYCAVGGSAAGASGDRRSMRFQRIPPAATHCDPMRNFNRSTYAAVYRVQPRAHRAAHAFVI